jgi:hypothetical protein
VDAEGSHHAKRFAPDAQGPAAVPFLGPRTPARFAPPPGFGYLPLHMSAVTHRWSAAGLLAVCALLASGCAARHVPLGDSPGEKSTAKLLGGLVVPLAVRSFDISAADGERGVFFKLSRVPDGITESHDSDPGRIILKVAGPATGEDLAPQWYPGADTLVSQIQMSRTSGQLQSVLQLSTPDPPPYSVHQMADWIMVRLEQPK